MLKFFGMVAVAFLLTACGGGDSTSAGSGSGGVTPPVAPAPLTINADNAVYIASVTTIGQDSLFSFAQLAVLAHDQLNQRPLKHSGEQQPFCRNAEGRSELQRNTTSDNFYIGLAQRFTINFENCFLAELDGVVSGQLEVSIEALSIDSYNLVIQAASYKITASNLQVVDEEGRIAIDLSTNLNYSGAATLYSYEITGGQNALQLHLPDNKVEKWQNFSSTLELDLSRHRYRLRTTGTLQSEVLGGSISVSTQTPLSGKLQREPDSGEIRFKAQGNSSLVLTSILSDEKYQALLTLPELSLQGSDDWLELSTGATWQKSGLSKDYVFRSAAEFVNYELERVGTGGTLNVILLPEQDIVLYFSDVVDRVSTWSNNLALRALDEQGVPIFGVPDIPVNPTIDGSVVTLSPSAPLRAGIRYRFDGIVAHRGGSLSANIPQLYVTLREELVVGISTENVLMRPGSTAEFVATVKSEGYDYQTLWSTDDTIATSQLLTKDVLTATFSPLNDQPYRLGSVTAQIFNVRGYELTKAYPYIVLAPEVENYFYHTSIGIDAHLSSVGQIQLFNINEDIGNATGIYTLVSGFFADNVYWRLFIRTGDDDRLVPGTYQLTAQQQDSGPYFEFDYIDRKCLPQRGQFTIDNIAYDDELPFVTELALSYDYECRTNQDNYRYRGQFKFKRGF